MLMKLCLFYLTTAKHQLYCFENNILDEYDLMARENGITMIKDLIESREILYNLGRKEGRTINIPTSMLPKLFYVRLDKHGGAELLWYKRNIDKNTAEDLLNNLKRNRPDQENN